MNWDVFGAVAELGGALAVVASLFYVGKQIRESSLATRGQTLNSLTNSLNTAAYEGLNKPVLLNIAMRAISNEELNEEEVIVYTTWVLTLLRSMESAYYQYELGLLDKSKLSLLIDSGTVNLSNRYGRQIWDSRDELYDSEFKDFVNSHLESRASKVRKGFGFSNDV